MKGGLSLGARPYWSRGRASALCVYCSHPIGRLGRPFKVCEHHVEMLCIIHREIFVR